jgi:hypothetical protein
MFDALRNDPRFQKRCDERPEATSREFFGKVKRRNGTVFDWLCVCCRVSDTDPQNWLIKGAFVPWPSPCRKIGNYALARARERWR